MSPVEDRFAKLVLAGVPATIIAAGIGLHLLPPGPATVILAVVGSWTCLSLPFGILVGHCVLGED